LQAEIEKKNTSYGSIFLSLGEKRAWILRALPHSFVVSQLYSGIIMPLAEAAVLTVREKTADA
jgi:hypothetical protein